MIVRLPNWLGDVVMSLPVLRALHEQNPDLTLWGKESFAPLMKYFLPELSFEPLPKQNAAYYWHFLRSQRPKAQDIVLLANSQRADLEAFFSSIPNRYGIAWQGRRRWLVNHRYIIHHPEADGARHQTQLWADFTAHFHLQTGISRTPLLSAQKTKAQIVLITGSENTPSKRWPQEKWRALIDCILQETTLQVCLTGSANDTDWVAAIAQGWDSDRVHNLVGKTNLTEFLDLLAESAVVVGNDTGGLHLANALAVPTIGLFGPTNPVRTRPIFDAPLAILQAENLAHIPDSQKMNAIEVGSVMSKIREFLA